MKTKTICRTTVLLTCIFTVLSCNRPITTPISKVTKTDFQRGITIACWDQSCLSGAQIETAMQAIKEIGANSVTLVVTGYQRTISATTIQYNQHQSPDDTSLKKGIEHAQKNGLEVTLKPHVDIMGGQWRGNLAPANIDTWFASYRDFIFHYADIAGETGVAHFVVGTELASLNKYENRWRTLIKLVRERYEGTILYAASWNEFERISFWDAVDIAGINAYFPLTHLKNPTLIDLLAGWQFWMQRIQQWHNHINKNVVFSEIGYTKWDGTNMRPFDFQPKTEVDLIEQASCYEAALRAMAEPSWLKGVSWWHWDVAHAATDRRFSAYSPQGRPAGTLLKQAWSTVN